MPWHERRFARALATATQHAKVNIGIASRTKKALCELEGELEGAIVILATLKVDARLPARAQQHRGRASAACSANYAQRLQQLPRRCARRLARVPWRRATRRARSPTRAFASSCSRRGARGARGRRRHSIAHERRHACSDEAARLHSTRLLFWPASLGARRLQSAWPAAALDGASKGEKVGHAGRDSCTKDCICARR